MRKLIGIILAGIIPNAALCQKLPQVQSESVRAPNEIKIDGRLKEWPQKPFLSAYNSGCRIYYTVSNDDKNLYFAIRGLGTRVTNKTLNSGLTITISRSTEKKVRTVAKDNISITFPVPQTKEKVAYLMGPVYSLNNFLSDTIHNKPQIDSILSLANKRLTETIKEIGIRGINDIADTSISIYNEQGFKAAIQMDKRMPIIEVAIPLKYLKISTETPIKFSYNIKLKGFDNNPIPALGSGVQLDPALSDNVNPDEAYLEFTTDFWGEYTLAPKILQ